MEEFRKPTRSESILSNLGLKIHKMELRLKWEKNPNKRKIMKIQIKEKKKAFNLMAEMINTDVLIFDEDDNV